MESTFDIEATRIPQLKTKQGLACKISRNKHMIEISSEVFVVGPTRARLYSTIMYKAVHMTYERPRVGIAKDSLRHNETIVKPIVDRRTTRRRTPISYHTSVGKISYELLEFPPIKLPKLSGYAIWCWGYMEAQYITQLTIPTLQLYPSVNT